MKKLLSLLCCCLVICSLFVPALAVDNYHFETTNPEEFYQSGVTTVTYDGAIPGYVQELYDFTPKTIYTSEYGATVIAPELDVSYGFASEKPTNAPGSSSSAQASAGSSTVTTTASNSAASGTVLYPELSGSASVSQYSLTPVEDVRNADGSIGTLKIPAIGLTVTAYDGEVTAAMKKGVGHVESTSSWNSNIGIVGHNRGTNNYFGKLKNVKIGDEITYTTILGTRTYVVITAQKIASNDWSYSVIHAH